MKVKLRSHEMQKYKWNSKISTNLILAIFRGMIKQVFFFKACPLYYSVLEINQFFRQFFFLQLTLIIQNNFENKTPWKNSYTLERHYNETF